MSKKNKHSLLTLALVVSLATTGETIISPWRNHAVFAQDTPTFTIPETVAEDTVVRIDGSTGMQEINEEFKTNFETKYPGTKVNIEYDGDNAALEALKQGEIDLAALGRPLTDAEKAEGFVEVPLARFKKIAVIVGQENPFTGSLTDEQFAQIFRGEITNWSEVGGPDLPIRVIDRPEESDTRQALSKYPVFQEKDFKSAPGAEILPVDATLEDVTQALGNDGISYGIYNKAEEILEIRVLPMFNTLPDDPKYPFSQPLAYVYKDQPTEAAKQFLGFAIGDVPEPVVEEPVVEEPVVEEPVVEEPVPVPTPTPAPAPEPSGGFPWWLIPLLLLLAGLGGWFLFGKKSSEEEEPAVVPSVVPPIPVVPPVGESSRVILVPRNCREGYAYWEVPGTRLERMRDDGGQNLKLRLYDVTAVLDDSENIIAEYNCDQEAQDLHFPIPADNRNYVTELGYTNSDQNWISLARSESVHVPACSRIILVPRSCREAYVYWEVPQQHLATGQQLKVRLYDVTDQEAYAGEMMAEADCNLPEQDLHISIPVDDRDYVADLGYTNTEGNWSSIVRSEPVHVPACAVGVEMGEMISAEDVITSGAATATVLTGVLQDNNIQNRIILVPRSCREAYAYWEISGVEKPGEQIALRLYDVTERDIHSQSSEEIIELLCSETDTDYHIPIPIDNRDYLVEIGSISTSGDWSLIARSEPVRVPPCDPTEEIEWVEATKLIEETTQDTPIIESNPFDTGNSGPVATLVKPQLEIETTPVGITPSSFKSRIILVPINYQNAYVYWELSQSQEQMQQAKLRLYDVTIAETELIGEFDCDVSSQDLHISIPVDNRDYLVELGYLDLQDNWVSLVKSSPVRVPSC